MPAKSRLRNRLEVVAAGDALTNESFSRTEKDLGWNATNSRRDLCDRHVSQDRNRAISRNDNSGAATARKLDVVHVAAVQSGSVSPSDSTSCWKRISPSRPTRSSCGYLS